MEIPRNQATERISPVMIVLAEADNAARRWERKEASARLRRHSEQPASAEKGPLTMQVSTTFRGILVAAAAVPCKGSSITLKVISLSIEAVDELWAGGWCNRPYSESGMPLSC